MGTNEAILRFDPRKVFWMERVAMNCDARYMPWSKSAAVFRLLLESFSNRGYSIVVRYAKRHPRGARTLFCNIMSRDGLREFFCRVLSGWRKRKAYGSATP